RQAAVGAQRAQVGQRQAAGVQAGAGGVGRHRRVLQSRDGGQVVDQAGLAGRQDLFLRNLDDRGRRVGGATTDTRTGDDDFADFSGLGVRRGLFSDLGRSNASGGDGADQNSAAQQTGAGNTHTVKPHIATRYEP